MLNKKIIQRAKLFNLIIIRLLGPISAVIVGFLEIKDWSTEEFNKYGWLITLACSLALFWIIDAIISYLFFKKSQTEAEAASKKEKERYEILLAAADKSQVERAKSNQRALELARRGKSFGNTIEKIAHQVESNRRRREIFDNESNSTIEKLNNRWRPTFEYIETQLEGVLDQLKINEPTLVLNKSSNFDVEQFFQIVTPGSIGSRRQNMSIMATFSFATINLSVATGLVAGNEIKGGHLTIELCSTWKDQNQTKKCFLQLHISQSKSYIWLTPDPLGSEHSTTTISDNENNPEEITAQIIEDGINSCIEHALMAKE